MDGRCFAPVSSETKVARATPIPFTDAPACHPLAPQVEKTLTCVGEDCRYSRSYLEPYTDFSVDILEPNGGEQLMMAAALGKQQQDEGEGGVPVQAFDLLAHCFKEQVRWLVIVCVCAVKVVGSR